MPRTGNAPCAPSTGAGSHLRLTRSESAPTLRQDKSPPHDLEDRGPGAGRERLLGSAERKAVIAKLAETAVTTVRSQRLSVPAGWTDGESYRSLFPSPLRAAPALSLGDASAG
jgi:hypothetical protein